MPGLLPNVDPDGLLEFSVVSTDRSLNHMSQRFQGVMTDISAFGYSDDVSFARALVANGGVAAVPGSSFYSDPKAGQQRLRFQFARRRETLEAAVDRLSRLKSRVRAGD